MITLGAKMKYLILVLLLVQPAFAIMPAKEARATVDKITEKKFKNELPTLLTKVEESIEYNSKLGFSTASLDVADYHDSTIRKVLDILSREGYTASVSAGRHYSSHLRIEW